MSSEPQEDSDREQPSAAEGTIVQNEEELCDLHKLLDFIWNPQLQLHVVALPQDYLSEEEVLCNQQRNSSVDHEDPEPPQVKEEIEEQEPSQIKEEYEEPEPPEIKDEREKAESYQNKDKQEEPEPPQMKEELEETEPSQMKEEQEEPEPPEIKDEREESESYLIKEEQEEPEPPQMKEELEGLCIIQDLKQETDTLMEIRTCEEVLPQHYRTEEEYLWNQQRNFKEKHEEPEPPYTEEGWGQLEPLPIKEEQEETCISQDEEQLDLKKETDILMEIPTLEENEYSETDLINQQSFNVTSSPDDEGNQHKESTLTTDEKTDQQNRKKRDKSHILNVDNSHISKSHCSSDVGKNSKKKTLVKKHKQSPKEKRISSLKSGKSSRKVNSRVDKDVTESVDRPYVCKECDTRFSQLPNFKKHLRNHTKEKSFSCKRCDKSFKQIFDLKRHMRTHTGEKPFVCKECNTGFIQMSDLKRHIIRHTGERPFSCKECNSSFYRPFDLQRHMRSHTGEKPYYCKLCDKRFSDGSHLRAHTRTHTEEKPFSCKECNKTFCLPSYLKKHMRSHTGERPFSCEQCDKRFSRISHLQRHMRTHS
ncbi:zinc finger protein 25 [Oryzias melastigma]|uniref:zinc finger protein 25 n=1 Tax=Oryzias melastigma TaxID=30732 RepID=UPI000CF7CEC2|nr:zinc finger protein 25 [Oryzias melastigma]